MNRLRHRSVGLLLAGMGLLVCLGVAVLAAPSRSKAKAKKAAPKIADIKSTDDRLAVLERIRHSFPALSGNARFTSENLDEAIATYVPRVTKTPFAAVVDDITFLRRVSLDLTGVSPQPEKIKTFLADQDPKKRAKVIDELLASDAYSRKWARYWRSVVFHDSSAQKNRVNPNAFEDGCNTNCAAAAAATASVVKRALQL